MTGQPANPTPSEIFAGPAVTALGLAASRSVESGRPDRLVHDPLARHLYTSAGLDLPMRLDWPGHGDAVTDTEALHLHGSRYIGLRTRYYDDFLVEAAATGIRQAVLLGAGLDTRAYRLPLGPELHLFELDRTTLLAWKRPLLTRAARARCRIADIGIDLREDWPKALKGAGFETGAPAAFVAEGLLAYLDPAEQTELLGRLQSVAAPGSRLALDRIVGNPWPRLAGLSERSGLNLDRWIAAGSSDRIGALLVEMGWELREELVAVVAGRYGRDLDDPFGSDSAGEPPWMETAFISARRPGSQPRPTSARRV